MKINMKDFVYSVLVFLLAMISSIYSFENIFFILSFPIILLASVYKEKFLFVGLLGMIMTSLLLDVTMLPFIVLISFSLTYLLSLLLRIKDMPIKIHVSSLAAFFGFFVCVGQYLINKNTDVILLVIIPAIMYFVTNRIIQMQFDFKSREKFSITKKQLTFLILAANLLIGTIFIKGSNFAIHFLVFTIINYVVLKLDKTMGILAILIGVVLSLEYQSYEALSFLSLSILALKGGQGKSYLSIACYGLVNIFVFYALIGVNYFLLPLLCVAFMLFFPRRWFDYLHKYIVDPQDYELKLYQQSYYKTLNQNKKIQKVMEILEKQLKNNPKMKKTSRDIILENMEFLRTKLNEEIDIHLKENILNELEYSKINVLSFKINSDLLNNHTIHLDSRSNDVSSEDVKGILERFLGVKLKLKDYKYNYWLSIESFVFVNEERVRFNVSIKQRSKEYGCCGDSYLNFNVKNKKYILVSDGMGHGKKASEDSASSLYLLKNFIELGMDPTRAIVSCNALIFDVGREKFNTLDLLEYDYFQDELSLYKNGSGATYIKNKENTIKIQSENLPLGIIENIRVNKINIDLNSEYIVLTSDGIKKELSNVIQFSKPKNAKALTSNIFQYEGDKIDDDQTIVAINIIKK